MSIPQPIPLTPYAAFWHRNFRYYLSARFLALASHQMLNVAMGQYIWELTHNTLYLGYIGLAIFIPKMAFAILAGHTADRYDRRWVIFICRVFQFLGVLGILGITMLGHPHLPTIYLLLFLVGTANAFDGPSSQSIIPQLIPGPHLSNAVTWNSSTMQISFIVGPLLSGWIYAASENVIIVLSIVGAMRLLSAILIYKMDHRTEPQEVKELSWHTLLAGLRYVFQKKIILGIISLDLFAVLLGGAVALFPVYANEIFKIGPSGLGMLRTAPALGAIFMAFSLAHLPPLKNAGKTMLACVAIFGLATIAFGISKNYVFSLVCLFILGAADMVSVVIRGVLIQIQTPPEMRGRVNAVNLVFIGASNELGEFESGLTARLWGVVPSVVIGGLGTLLVVGLWAWKFPEMRNVKRLDTTT